MAKYETKIKANLAHLMEYVQNSLNPDFLPVDQLEPIVREYDDVKIIFRSYGTNAGRVMVIYTVKSGEEEICVEILNAGMFGQKFVYEDGGEKYEKYLSDAFSSYDPTKTGKENRYIPPKKETKGLFKTIKEIFNK